MVRIFGLSVSCTVFRSTRLQVFYKKVNLKSLVEFLKKKKEKEETVAHDQMDYASGYPGGFMISIKQKGSFKNYVCVSWGYSLLMFKSFALGNF